MGLYDDYYRTRFAPDARRAVLWATLTRYFQRWIPADADVLELGAGYCEFINRVRARSRTALDLNEEVRVHAGPDVRTHVGSCADLSFLADGSVDVVLASNLFEHLGKADFITALEEVRRVLRAGGRLIVMQPNFATAWRNYFDDYTHMADNILTHVSLCDHLQAAGFTVRDCQPRFMPFSIKSRLPVSGWLIRLYLALPWRPFAGQMLVVAEAAPR